MSKLDDYIKMGRHQQNHPGKHFWTNDIPTLILPFEREMKFVEFFRNFSNFSKIFRTKIAHQNAEEVETDRQNFIFNQLRKRNFSWTDDVIDYDLTDYDVIGYAVLEK